MPVARRVIGQHEATGETRAFDSITEAAREAGVSRARVHRVCSRVQGQACGGWVFAYEALKPYEVAREEEVRAKRLEELAVQRARTVDAPSGYANAKIWLSTLETLRLLADRERVPMTQILDRAIKAYVNGRVSRPVQSKQI